MRTAPVGGKANHSPPAWAEKFLLDVTAMPESEAMVVKVFEKRR